MKIGIASDHAGFHLKEFLMRRLEDISWVDLGCNSEKPMDYPEIVPKLCRQVLNGKIDFGVLLCGTGIGVSITANRFLGIRAALCHNHFTAEMARRHNNANILAMGARVVSNEDSISICQTFTATPSEDGRHQRRVEKIDSVVTTVD